MIKKKIWLWMYMEQEEVGLNKADSIINFITNSYPGCCYLHPQVHKFMVAPHSHKCLKKKTSSSSSSTWTSRYLGCCEMYLQLTVLVTVYFENVCTMFHPHNHHHPHDLYYFHWKVQKSNTAMEFLHSRIIWRKTNQHQHRHHHHLLYYPTA